MIYYGLEKWFAKNCSVIILMVEFGWNFTLLGPCTKLFIKGRREKEKEKKRKRSEEEIEKKKKRKKKKKKKNEKGMQLLEGNSCEPLLQRHLACFWNYLCILSFLCLTHSPLAPLQPRLNDQSWFWNPNRTVRSDRKNLEPLIFCGSFSLKNHSMEKKGTRVNCSRTSQFWKPWSNRFPWFLASLWIWTLKIKNKIK